MGFSWDSFRKVAVCSGLTFKHVLTGTNQVYTQDSFWATPNQNNVVKQTPKIIGGLPKRLIRSDFNHCGQNVADVRLNFQSSVEFVGFDGQPAFDFEIGHEDFQPEDFRLLGGAS